MNILLFGPGNSPTKFGGFFLDKAKKDGHKIKTLSHGVGIVTPDSSYVNFRDPDDFKLKLMNLLQDIDKIDLFLYNSNGGGGINSADQFTAGHLVDVEGWVDSAYIHGICLNLAVSASLLKMDASSSAVFLSSSASYLINRDNYLQHASYFGFKGIQNQMMRGYAEYNDKGVTFSVFAPHIPYEDSETAEKVMSNLYDRAINLRKEDNGKIIQFYPPEGNPHYHDK
jgi:hypothetical protein